MSFSPGTPLGPYSIVSPLGAGGMGEVYRARDTRLDRDVAIKVLPAHLAGSADSRARFEREAKAVAALSHPNILAIYDVGHQNGIAYVVTELLEGATLRQLLLEGAIARRRTLEIAIAVADGLAAAHARGIVHRDLKPENIFLTTDGVVKILDFGLARTESAGSASQDAAHTPTVTLHTSPGTVLGTINYMSPEQIRAQRTDARSDVFSFGCVLYEMLTGARAFQGETSADTMTAILREAPKSILSARHDMGTDLERVIERCLEKKPETRFQSSQDLAFTLRSILAACGTAVEQWRPATPAVMRSRIPWPVKAAIMALIAGGLVVGAFMVRRELRLVRREAGETIDSLAVLPLENVSRDPEQEYFVDGMTEALISDLAKIGGLKVISRTSVMRYKATTKSLPEIAKELNVDAVVEGSVLRVGERVRITAQLIHAATDTHLWSESYDRDLRDVLRLHSEVARTIAQQIKVTLTPQVQARMVAARPINPEAYKAYLNGRFYLNKRTPEALEKSIDYFEQASRTDPSFAPAYAGLADSYVLYASGHFAPPAEGFPRTKAKAAALKAVELDDMLAEAHYALARVLDNYEWDWSGAEREYQRALALSPNYALAHQYYGLHSSIMGRHEEAIAAARRAVELDPVSAPINNSLGTRLLNARRYDEAIEQYRKTLELHPDFTFAQRNMGEAFSQKGMGVEAVTLLERVSRLSEGEPSALAQLATAYAFAGKKAEARRLLNELTNPSKPHHAVPYRIALVHAALGEKEQAFEWLERAYNERDPELVFLNTELVLDALRDDPRFADLVRRVGLPPLAPLPSETATSKPFAGKITLAVLPFANDSGDSELDYLSDGIAETLINGFSRLEGLRTVPRSTAFRHRGENTDPVQVGRQLSATAVLSGRVLKRGDNLTIQAELVDVAEGRQLWGERYQKKLADLVEIERDIAKDITDALRMRLTGEEKRMLSRGYSENAEAYRLYLEGRFWWNKRTKEGFENTLRLLDKATKLDPTFALAHSGIADTYSLMPMYGFITPREGFAKAQAATDRALQLDDQLAEAHTSMGMVRMYGDWDFERSEKEFKLAMQLNPRYPTAHHWYALCVGMRGRFAEARTELRRAIELDPLAPIFTHNLSWVANWEHHWSETLSIAEAGLEFAPEFPWLHQSAGHALLELGRADESLVHMRKAAELAPLASFAWAYLGYALARTDHEQEARALLAERLEFAESHYVPPTDVAMIYVGLGEFDEAFRWLEKGLEVRDTWMMFLGVATQWDPLRDDPRFVDLLRRVGLPNLRAGNAPTDPSNFRPAP